MNERMLYGRPGDEYLRFDPSEVVQEWLDYRDSEDDVPSFVIEEFSVHPPKDHLPDADVVLEWIEEWSANCAEISDESGEWMAAARKDPAVLVATEALLDAIASKITWRQANVKLRELVVTPNPDDPENPLIDGEPSWVRVALHVEEKQP